jgi:nucleoid-associated protein YgaU
MYNPLVIFTGAALATLAALLGVTYDRWSATAHDHMAVAGTEAKSPPAESRLEDMAAPAAAEEPTPEKKELASLAPREPTPLQPPAETPAASFPGVSDQPEPPAGDSKPTFDTIRIERDGSAVIAGRGLPDSDVTVMLNGSPLGRVKADLEGAWVFIPEAPMPPGDHELTLRMNRKGTLTVDSEQSVALKVPERLGEAALVVLSDADQPSKVLQKPDSSENETTIAKSEPSASLEKAQGDTPASGELALATVDYNDVGEIIFSGQAEAGTSVRLYVDNRSVGDAAVAADGTWTFADNEDIAPGNHSLRVDQLQRDGSVSRRIELPFVRATPQDIASLNDPAQAEPKADYAADAAPALPEPIPTASADEPPSARPAAMEQSPGSEMANVEHTAEAAPAALDPESLTDSSGKLASADPPAAPAEPSLPRNGKIVIQPGNSLWRISRVIYGRGIEYTVIYEANKDYIRNPNLIYPGQIFATPGVVPPESIDPKSTTPLANTTSNPTSQQ